MKNSDFGKSTKDALVESGASDSKKFFLRGFYEILSGLMSVKKKKFNRVLPMGEYFVDRWEKAKFLGFGVRASVYDSAVVLGDVSVGQHTWIGPNVILDGSGGLSIGRYCSVSAGVQIYSHDSTQWSTTGGKVEYEYEKTTIGDNCYIGPNAIIVKGVTIGDGVIIGANSFVNKDVPSYHKAYGSPVVISRIEKK